MRLISSVCFALIRTVLLSVLQLVASSLLCSAGTSSMVPPPVPGVIDHLSFSLYQGNAAC